MAHPRPPAPADRPSGCGGCRRPAGEGGLFVALMLVVGRRVVPWMDLARARGPARSSCSWPSPPPWGPRSAARSSACPWRWAPSWPGSSSGSRAATRWTPTSFPSGRSSPSSSSCRWGCSSTRLLAAHAGGGGVSALVVVGKTGSPPDRIPLRAARPEALVVAAGLSPDRRVLVHRRAGRRAISGSWRRAVPADPGRRPVPITVNPLVFRLVGPVGARSRPPPERRLGAAGSGRRRLPRRRDHVVIVGCGRVGGHIVDVLGRLEVPRLVVESDPGRGAASRRHARALRRRRQLRHPRHAGSTRRAPWW